jgi:hypothetical protein
MNVTEKFVISHLLRDTLQVKKELEQIHQVTNHAAQFHQYVKCNNILDIIEDGLKALSEGDQ